MDLKQIAPSDLVTRYKNGAFPADGLVLMFTLFLLLVGLLNYSCLGHPSTWISIDCGILIILTMLIGKETHDSDKVYSWGHFLWPVITLAFLYSQCAAWDNLVFKNTFDPVLIRYDISLFGVNLNKYMAPAVNNIWIDEIMHAFYFSYYLILFLPAVWLRQQRIPQAFEIVFSLVLMLYVHFLFFMVFPSDGPIPERSHIFGRGIVFIPLMNFIYQASEQGGGGAFPSTHVSAAVLVFLYTFRYAPKLRLPVGLSCAGVILATVYCSYHYAIDSVAGMATGTLFFFIGQYVYARLRHPVVTAPLIVQQNV